MDFFLILILLFILLWVRASLLSGFRDMTQEIRNLREQVNRLSGSAPPQPPPPPPAREEFMQPEPAPESPPPFIVSEPAEPEPPPAPEIYEPEPAPVYSKPVYTEPKAPQPSFFERHPDLEKFIGENLINKVGIGILVLGIAFFVKYAIDKDWIGVYGRVGIGILAGGLLIGIAHRLRKTFKAFSSVLVGGGLAVLYFTIAIAFHQYKIIGQDAAFIIMVVITAFAVMLSIAYDRMELAVLAMIGGFTTPFMVSTGEGNFKVLFTYLLILNIGLLALAFRKRWNLVNILSCIFTVILYGSWLILKCLDMPGAPYGWALAFGTAFYLVFFLTNLLYNFRHRLPFRAFEISMLLANTALYYAAGMSILHYVNNGALQGLFTVSMGVFHFAFAFLFVRRQNVDRNLVYLLVGLVLTFVSLAAPIQLEGNHITLFWSAEAVLLLWLSRKSGLVLMKATSFLVLFLMLISLLMDWQALYVYGPNQVLMPVLNKAFLTSVVALAAVFLFQKLLAREEGDLFRQLPAIPVRRGVQVLFAGLLYMSLLLELRYQVSYAWDASYALSIATACYNMLFVGSAFFYLRKRMNHFLALVLALLAGFCLLTYVVEYNFSLISARYAYLSDGQDSFFLMHIPLALLFGMTAYVLNQASKAAAQPGDAPWIKWITVMLILYICSAELNHFGTWFSYEPGRLIPYINKQIEKAGYTVLWGLVSFLLMQQGMKRKDRLLRIISLSVFLLTILKLFLWDIRGISEGGKIIAFISLGVLLLTVSFMYQRLKKLILDSDAVKAQSDGNT